MSVRSINVNKEDSQNLDLIIRNGLAGGVAGCAVSLVRSPWGHPDMNQQLRM
jgi:hypothetical protein